MAEAATLYGVSPTTIRRRLKEKPARDGRRRATALPNPHRDETGAWMIPVDDLETAQFKAGTPVGTAQDNRSKRAEPPNGPDSLRDELAAAQRRVAVAEVMATEARRELVERLADKDEIIRATRETMETQNATITALTQEVKDRDYRLAIMAKRIKPLGAAAPGRI